MSSPKIDRNLVSQTNTSKNIDNSSTGGMQGRSIQPLNNPQQSKISKLLHKISQTLQKIAASIMSCFFTKKEPVRPKSILPKHINKTDPSLPTIKGSFDDIKIPLKGPFDDIKIPSFGNLAKLNELLYNEQIRLNHRANLEHEANVFAKGLAAVPKEINKAFEIQGQINVTGNACYMNAALQNLENLYRDDPSLQRLISSNLALQAGETIVDLEERILKQWAPISPLANKKELENRLAVKRRELSEITGSSKDEQYKKFKLNEDIVFINKQLTEWQDGILFKWSYLLLLQAKKYGSQEHKDEVLRFHHKLCFELARHSEFYEGPRDQKDASGYFELWHDLLGFKTLVRQHLSAIHTDHRSEKIEPYTIISVGLPATIQGLQKLQAAQKAQGKDLSIDQQKHLKELLEEKQLQAKKNRSEEDNKRLEALKPPTIDLCVSFSKSMLEEIRDADNPWEAEKGTWIAEYNKHHYFAGLPPDTLTVQVKRFESDPTVYGATFKNETPIELGFDPNNSNINLEEFFLPENIKTKKPYYMLSGIVCHQGYSANSGHYIAYIRKGASSEWMYVSDSSTAPADIKTIPFNQAYMFTFRRVDEEPADSSQGL